MLTHSEGYSLFAEDHPLLRGEPFPWVEPESVKKQRDWVKRLKALDQGSADWQEARSVFQLNCSDLGAALGVDPHKSKARLVALKRGQLFEEKAFSRAAMDWGHAKEPVAASDIESVLGISLVSTGIWSYKGGTLLGGSPDRLWPSSENPQLCVEIKCPFTGIIPKKPRSHHLAQLLGTMACTETKKGMLCYWTTGGMVIFDVAWDQSLWDKHIVTGIASFLDELRTNPNRIVTKQKHKEKMENLLQSTVRN